MKLIGKLVITLICAGIVWYLGAALFDAEPWMGIGFCLLVLIMSLPFIPLGWGVAVVAIVALLGAIDVGFVVGNSAYIYYAGILGGIIFPWTIKYRFKKGKKK